jgi:chemotaxis response regulator CheB
VPALSATSIRVVLATSDPVFAALCQRAFLGTRLELVASVAPAELLETMRRLAPELLVLDADSEDAQALKLLATKVMLVSEARVVLVSAWLAPGSPGLCALLQSIAGTFVQKPEGPSSLGLADADGPAFVAALEAAFAAHENWDLHVDLDSNTLPSGFDAGWGTEND